MTFNEILGTNTRARLRIGALVGSLFSLLFLITACSGQSADDIAFDGQYFRTKTSKVDDQWEWFEVSISPASASLEGAREAGRYEGTRYCVQNFGTSVIDWIDGPDAEDGTLVISDNKLLLSGTCKF